MADVRLPASPAADSRSCLDGPSATRAELRPASTPESGKLCQAARRGDLRASAPAMSPASRVRESDPAMPGRGAQQDPRGRLGRTDGADSGLARSDGDPRASGLGRIRRGAGSERSGKVPQPDTLLVLGPSRPIPLRSRFGDRGRRAVGVPLSVHLGGYAHYDETAALCDLAPTGDRISSKPGETFVRSRGVATHPTAPDRADVRQGSRSKRPGGAPVARDGRRRPKPTPSSVKPGNGRGLPRSSDFESHWLTHWVRRE